MRTTLTVGLLAAGLTLTGGTAASAVEPPRPPAQVHVLATGDVIYPAGWGPDCAEAWVALYAWAAANSAICAGYGLLGPAGAFGCWAVVVGIGAGLPFNNACD